MASTAFLHKISGAACHTNFRVDTMFISKLLDVGLAGCELQSHQQWAHNSMKFVEGGH